MHGGHKGAVYWTVGVDCFLALKAPETWPKDHTTVFFKFCLLDVIGVTAFT